MAEVKNAFIKSKMNKDLDDRLIPQGEYREGINIQVSKSEGQDVGALENVLGNNPATSSDGTAVDFSVIAGLATGTTVERTDVRSAEDAVAAATSNAVAAVLFTRVGWLG